MSERKQLARARQPADLEAVRSQVGGFDIDMWHVMDRQDDSLIGEEVIHGATSGAFVYSFSLQGQTVAGISVIGAAHLARHYGGLKHRLVASAEKRGALHIFTSYPHDGQGMTVATSQLYDVEGEPDFYKVLVEITDIKTGNSIQVEKMETRHEKRRDGSLFERQHFAVIAQSKAYRNAVLRIVPQDVQSQFKDICLKQGKSKDISASAIDEKRNAVMAFSTKNGLSAIRDIVMGLSWAQISGLSEAARDGLPAFVNAGKALGIFAEQKAIEEKTEPAINIVEPKQEEPVKAPAMKQEEPVKAPAMKQEQPKADSQGDMSW